MLVEKMKKDYSTPEIKSVNIKLRTNILNYSVNDMGNGSSSDVTGGSLLDDDDDTTEPGGNEPGGN